MSFLKVAALSIAMLGLTMPGMAQESAPPPAAETSAAPAPAPTPAPEVEKVAASADKAAHSASDGHAEGGHGGGHGVSAKAVQVFGPITNSMLVAIIVALLVTWFCRSAMKNPTLVPGKKQNVVEFLIEFLYKQVENIVGKHVAPRAFPLLATIFIFVLCSNYFGLLPGIGTIGYSSHVGPWGSVDHVEKPLFRPATADMNFTVGIALVAMVVWLILTLQELGVKGFLEHTFGPKGGLKGVMKYALLPIFMFVGVIEIISIVFRPVSLSFRLYGNIFAGENLLHVMSDLGKSWGPVGSFISKVALPLPFYFLELLVGVLQAMVFSLLCAVYIQLSTTHEEGHGEHH